MKIAIPIPDMKALRANRTRGFTLIEMLVVIAIIAVVAGLVVGLAGVASSNKKLSRSKVELQKLVTLIEAYKAKVGVYPPHNSDFDSKRNSLLYELAGALRDTDPPNDTDPLYTTHFGTIKYSTLTNELGLSGVINAVDKPISNEVTRVLKELHPDQFRANLIAPGVSSLIVPVDGPDGKLAAWNYRVGTNAVHNPDTYDLWVDIVVRGNTTTIGNWKN